MFQDIEGEETIRAWIKMMKYTMKHAHAEVLHNLLQRELLQAR